MSQLLFILQPLFLIVLLGTWIYCLVDALRFHRSWFWVLFVLCLGPFAAVVYLPNFKLQRHRRSGLLDDMMADSLRLKELQAQAAEAGIPALHLEIAEIYTKRHRWQEALEALKEVLAQDEENSRAHHLAGVCFQALGQPEGALAHLEYVLEEDPRFARGRTRLAYANALFDLDRTEEAAAEYERVLAEQSIPEAAFQRARLLAGAGEKSAAMETLEDALDHAKEFPAERKAEECQWIQAAREYLNSLRKE